MDLVAELKSKPWLLGFGLFSGLGFLLIGGVLSGSNPTQPLRYNHAVHISNGMACEDCHAGARGNEKATLPGIDVCLGCHREPLTKSPEEEKIRAFARSGQEIPWVQVTRVPRHVYFSHRRHVTLGGLKCAECHGPMETRTEPVRRPFRPMTMDGCMECHEQRKVSDNCNDCHR